MAKTGFTFRDGMSGGFDKLKRLNYPEIIDSMEVASVIVQKHARDNHPRHPDNIKNPDGTIRYHNVTATLTRSIDILPVKSSKESVEGGIFTNLIYALIIELKFPYISVAIIAKGKDITLAFSVGVAKVLRRGKP